MNEKRSSGAFPPRTGGAPHTTLAATAFSLLLSTLPGSGEANDEVDFNKIGRFGYALWDCAAIGQIAQEDEQLVQQLIERGYDQLSVLVDAWRDGMLTEQNTAELPIAFRWYLIPGPSADFSLGYMWAKFNDYAHEETWPDLEEMSYDDQKELQEIRAETEFRTKNCAVL